MNCLLLSVLFILSSLNLTLADCTGRQSYVFSVDFRFTRATEVTLPDKTRVPILVAVIHQPSFRLFQRTQRVDDDVAEVAQNWSAERIKRFFEREKDEGKISDYVIQSDLEADGSTRFDLVADEGSNVVSLIAPMVPSPAWFMGVESRSLCTNGTFSENEVTVNAENYDSGLSDGSSWGDDLNPFERDQRQPVGELTNIEPGTVFATLAYEPGSLGVDWWKIFLGVLVGVAVLMFLFLCVIPRLRRRKKHREIPLTAPDGVQW